MIYHAIFNTQNMEAWKPPPPTAFYEFKKGGYGGVKYLQVTFVWCIPLSFVACTLCNPAVNEHIIVWKQLFAIDKSIDILW